ncbi:MAG: hypothetical protein AAGA46_16595 [Cyanobacteria bacterium P01_F01_bin.13]
MTILSRLVSQNLLAGLILTIVVQPSLANVPLLEELSLGSEDSTAVGNLSTLAQTSVEDMSEAEENGSAAESKDREEAADDALRIVVTATRTEEVITNVPRSVRVIDREDLQQQLELTNNLSDVLGKLIPGFAPPPLQSATGRTHTFLYNLALVFSP